MRIELIIKDTDHRLDWPEGPNLRRTINLLVVPRVGDVLWADTKTTPSLTKLLVRQIEWFERGPFVATITVES